MNRMKTRSALVVRILGTAMVFALLAAACGSSSTAVPAEPTVAAIAAETVDPASVESIEEALEAMATFAAAESPEAAADPEAYMDGLSEAEQEELLARTFGFTTEEEVQAFINKLQGVSPEDLATFSVDGTQAMMTGLINSSTPNDVRQLIADHPEVTTIVMLQVLGSIDDEANLEAALLVREAELNTHLNFDSVVASGGVDFFLAGVERTFEPGASFGVHSWADSAGNQGIDIPQDDPEHLKYLDYYDQVGIDRDFYWFTLDAAPADDIHLMTAEELAAFGFATKAFVVEQSESERALQAEAQVIAEDFANEASKAGFVGDLPVSVTVRSTPSLVFAAPGVGITIPDWETVDDGTRGLFETLAASSDGAFTAEKFFKDSFNWFFVPHEAGHQLDFATRTTTDDFYAGEIRANEIAIAYWKINYRAELDEYIESVEALLDTLPTPEDTSSEFFNANYDALGADPAAYGYFQFFWILDAYERVDTLELADYTTAN